VAEHKIKYADYDEGQPESEKKGLLIRNKRGDRRVLLLGFLFLIVPLVIGGIFAIPGMSEFFENRKNTSEIAFGNDAYKFEGHDCGSRLINVRALHEAKDLTDASALEVTIKLQTRSKGTLASESTTVSLVGVDLDSPTRLEHGITEASLLEASVDPAQGPALCAYEIEIVR